MASHLVEIPSVDPSRPWNTIAIFESKAEAINYADTTFGSSNGLYNMISHDGEWYIADVPLTIVNSTNNQHVEVESFRHKSDCLDFVQENYHADYDGNISLIATV
ncbi:hypothetical protein H1P_850012 [Hyella patelloides LEGE 07179]|uniref:Uncharacterized protein n=1 Tax=Hyella patelloides LEGE 07179 TaxID=945734 RepID=A0A563W4Q5_9CYAN|nr:hypothetical protein [Hyella patelloides]VEP18655.1 hypothetical protein H1P_850012 [Hyella patelloides LEGE 07179]